MNTKSLRGTAARLAVTAAALLLAAAAAAQSADKEAVDVLRQIEAKYAQVPSVSGAFTQTRELLRAVWQRWRAQPWSFFVVPRAPEAKD
jgi:ABC-type sugar transport system substrate-binding protein